MSKPRGEDGLSKMISPVLLPSFHVFPLLQRPRPRVQKSHLHSPRSHTSSLSNSRLCQKLPVKQSKPLKNNQQKALSHRQSTNGRQECFPVIWVLHLQLHENVWHHGLQRQKNSRHKEKLKALKGGWLRTKISSPLRPSHLGTCLNLLCCIFCPRKRGIAGLRAPTISHWNEWNPLYTHCTVNYLVDCISVCCLLFLP